MRIPISYTPEDLVTVLEEVLYRCRVRGPAQADLAVFVQDFVAKHSSRVKPKAEDAKKPGLPRAVEVKPESRT